MTPVEIGVIGIIALFALLAIRVPAGIAMIVVAAIGNSMLSSAGPALLKMGSDLIRTTQSQTLSVVPLFVLMGIFLAKADLGVHLFDLLNYFVGRRKGGMATATIGAGILFGSVSGSCIAASTTLASACAPEMRRHNYEEGFSVGICAVGACVGMVIPPSSALVVYGFLTEESIGQVLMGGIIPGLLTGSLLMLTVPIVVRLRPNMAPKATLEKTPFPWKTLKAVWGIPVIFLAVFGGIYLGWATTTEAGAIGAFSSMVFALLMRKLSLKVFINTLTEAAKVTAMVFFMIMGGNVFGVFLQRSLIPMALTDFVATLDIAPVFMILLFLLVYTVLGLFMDEMATLIIMTPIAYPIAISLGYNGIWFGVMSIMMLLTGTVSPPVGIVTMVSSAVSKVSSTKVFASQWPFWITLIISCIIIASFPGISMLIPNLMYS